MKKKKKGEKLVKPAGNKIIRSNEVRELLKNFLEESKEESYSWEHITSEDFLPHNWIYDLFRDSKDRIWVGTWGGGAVMLDGEDWKTYNIYNGLLSNAVTSIKEDKEGTIWMATDNGINTITDNKISEIGLRGKRLLNITFDKYSNLWVCCWGTLKGEPGIYKYDGKNWKGFTKSDGVPGREILKVFEDSRGYIWIGTYEFSIGAGVGCFDGKKWNKYDHMDGLPDNCVYSMFEDPEGNMWFGTVGGIGIFDVNQQKWHKLTRKDGLIDNSVYSMIIDSKNKMWFGTEGGVSRYDGENWKSFTTKDGLIENLVRCIVEDKENNIWFGTYPYARGRGGISKLTTNKKQKKFTDKILDKLPGPLNQKVLRDRKKKDN